MSFDFSEIFAADRADATPAPTRPRRFAPAPPVTVPALAPDTVERIPAAPPPDVIEAIGAAARAYDRLLTRGRRLHFDTGGATRLSIQVQDMHGHLLGTLSPSEALDLAAEAMRR